MKSQNNNTKNEYNGQKNKSKPNKKSVLKQDHCEADTNCHLKKFTRFFPHRLSLYNVK